MATYETVLYEQADGVATVTLNRPDVHNAFNSLMQRELHTLWRALRATTTCAASCSPAPARRRSAPASTAWSRWAASARDTTDPDVVGSG